MEYGEKLHHLQREHGLRLGNRLAKRHINFKCNKMKVNLTVQAIVSDSVAHALKWACMEQFHTTANFLHLTDKTFHNLKCQSPNNVGFKVALNPGGQVRRHDYS